MSKRTYLIDGERFSTLEEFFDQISAHVIPGASWARNLDAFNDILRGGFGTPEEGFILEWRNSALSKTRLG
jgi:RNAse (barnase) inhibitor barstar